MKQRTPPLELNESKEEGETGSRVVKALEIEPEFTLEGIMEQIGLGRYHIKIYLVNGIH